MTAKGGHERGNERALIWAAKRGDRLAIRKAVHAGVNLNAEDISGWTPLFHAAARGDTHAVTLLIDSGADVNHGQANGFTALFAAVLGGHLKTVELLLNAGALVVPVHGIELVGYVQNRESARSKKMLSLLSDAAVGRR